MKKNFDKAIKAIDGTDLEIAKNDEQGGSKKVTFKDRIIDSLLSGQQADKPDLKSKLYRLFVKIQAATNETDYTVDELTLIKDRCGIFQPVLIYGQIMELIDTDDKSD